MNLSQCTQDSKNNKSIFGIDPGLQATGWGVIEVTEDAKIQLIDCGTIKTKPKDDIYNRLHVINSSLLSLFKKHIPEHVCLEEAFPNQHAFSSLKLGIVRGVIIAATFDHQNGFDMQFSSYFHQVVRKGLLGKGRATKEEVEDFVMKNIVFDNYMHCDNNAFDALAIAMHHASILHHNLVFDGKV